MPRPRRVPTLFGARCNGDEIDGCSFEYPRSSYSEDGFAVKEAAKRHAREARHEVVVTEETLVVYDHRRKGQV